METYPKESISREDIMVIGSNGLWDNLYLDILHYELRGPGSFIVGKKGKYPDAVGSEEKSVRPLGEMADRVGKVA